MHGVLLACWTYTVRMRSAYREHMSCYKNPTNAQRVASERNKRPAGMQRWTCVRCALDLSQRTCNPACALRVSGVGPAHSEHVWRPSGVLLASCRMFIHASSSDWAFSPGIPAVSCRQRLVSKNKHFGAAQKSSCDGVCYPDPMLAGYWPTLEGSQTVRVVVNR